jgi:hypothetical protein
VKTWPAIVAVPARDAPELLAVALSVTVPPPFPDCPPVMVSQGVLLIAVQAQPVLVKTNTDAVVAVAAAETLSGDIE